MYFVHIGYLDTDYRREALRMNETTYLICMIHSLCGFHVKTGHDYRGSGTNKCTNIQPRRWVVFMRNKPTRFWSGLVSHNNNPNLMDVCQQFIITEPNILDCYGIILYCHGFNGLWFIKMRFHRRNCETYFKFQKGIWCGNYPMLEQKENES